MKIGEVAVGVFIFQKITILTFFFFFRRFRVGNPEFPCAIQVEGQYGGGLSFDSTNVLGDRKK